MSKGSKSLRDKMEELPIRAQLTADKLTDRLSEAYEGDTSLRLLLGLLPVLGPRLDMILSEPGRRAKERRFHAFMQSVDERLQQIDEDVSEFVNSPEFEDAVRRIGLTATLTSREEKIELLRQALVGTIRAAGKDPLTPTLLDALDVLSPEHVLLLRSVRDRIRDGARRHDAERGTALASDPIRDLGDGFCPAALDLRAKIPESSWRQCDSIVDDLIGRGFLEVVPPIQGVVRPKKQEVYRPTPLGERLLELLEKGMLQVGS